MLNLILTHGAWHSADCWKQLVPYLKDFATVYTPNMPGRQFERTRAFKQISLKDYVSVIEQCIEDIKGPIVLLGHSLAGLSISQVAENLPERIQQLIYLSAFIAKSGESMFSITEKIDSPGVSTELDISPKENKMTLRPTKRTEELFYNLCNKNDAAHAVLNLIPEPLKAFTTPVELTEERFGRVKKTYIQCSKDNAILLNEQQKMVNKSGITQCSILDSDHSPFISQPETLANLIKKICIT